MKHCVTSTMHASMGDTLHKVAMEISNIDNCFKLWGKELVIVTLSQTKLGKITIVIGDKRGNINAQIFPHQD